jgi:hypothetical protein
MGTPVAVGGNLEGPTLDRLGQAARSCGVASQACEGSPTRDRGWGDQAAWEAGQGCFGSLSHILGLTTGESSTLAKLTRLNPLV